MEGWRRQGGQGGRKDDAEEGGRRQGGGEGESREKLLRRDPHLREHSTDQTTRQPAKGRPRQRHERPAAVAAALAACAAPDHLEKAS